MIWFKIALEATAMYLFFILIGLGYTGNIERAYRAIPQDSTLMVAGKSLSASELAIAYKPVLSLADGVESPSHQDLKWEAVDEPDAVVLVYRAEWSNENQPNWWKNIPMYIYRFPYFGLTWKDSEYLQLRIRKSDGALMDAQMPVLKDQKRVTAQYYFEEKEVVFSENGAEIKKEALMEEFSKTLHVSVVNWDHVYNLEGNHQGSKLDFELVYLSDEAYEKGKYCRRDQGVYASFEPVSNLPIILFVGGIFIIYFIFLRRGVHYKYVEGHGDVEKPLKTE